MARTQHDPVAEIVHYLRAQGFTVEPTGHGHQYVLASDDGTLAYRPLLALPPELLSELPGAKGGGATGTPRIRSPRRCRSRWFT